MDPVAIVEPVTVKLGYPVAMSSVRDANGKIVSVSRIELNVNMGDMITLWVVDAATNWKERVVTVNYRVAS